MPTLVIDKDRCIGCGQCAADCLPQALQMRDGSPAMVKEESCMDCHHCLAVCPVGALTINGHGPGESAALEKTARLFGFVPSGQGTTQRAPVQARQHSRRRHAGTA